MTPTNFDEVHTEYTQVDPMLRALANLATSGFTQEQMQPTAEIVAAKLEALAAKVRGS